MAAVGCDMWEEQAERQDSGTQTHTGRQAARRAEPHIVCMHFNHNVRIVQWIMKQCTMSSAAVDEQRLCSGGSGGLVVVVNSRAGLPLAGAGACQEEAGS